MRADGLDVPELRALVGCGHKGIDVVVGHEGGLDAEVIEGVQQDVPAAAVQGVGGHDLVPGLGDVGERKDLGGMPGSDGHCGGGALDGGNARSDTVGGGVGQTAVDVSRSSEGELLSGVLGVVKLPCGSGIDGQGCRPRGRVGGQTGVNLKGVEVLGGILGEGGVEFKRHGCFLSGLSVLLVLFQPKW